jgi:hypothetical protein
MACPLLSFCLQQGECNMASKVQNTQHKRKPVQQARGKALRAKIIQSEEYGEDFRANHQGQDVRTEKGG